MRSESRRGEQRIKALDQFRSEVLVAGKLGESQRAIPGADLGINNVLGVLMRAGDKMLRYTLADLLRGSAGGPIGEVVGLGGGGEGEERDGCDEDRDCNGFVLGE